MEIQIFENEQFGQLRGMTIEGEPWFVGKDVAQVLGYKDASKAVCNRVDKEDKTTLPIQQCGSNYKSQTTFINESGLYSLILSSKLPKAREFKLLTQQGFPIGQTRLFAWMRRHGYLFQRETRPIQRWVEQGLFDTSVTLIQTHHGTEERCTTKVTGKGQEYFVAGFLSGRFAVE